MIRFKPNRGWQLQRMLFTNTYNEFAEAEDQIINVQMAEFMESIKQLFIEKRTDKSKDEETVCKPTIYYLQNTVLRSIKSQQ
jgi:hypothetical protein